MSDDATAPMGAGNADADADADADSGSGGSSGGGGDSAGGGGGGGGDSAGGGDAGMESGMLHWLDVAFKELAPEVLPELLTAFGIDLSEDLGQEKVPEPELMETESAPQPQKQPGRKDLVIKLVGVAGVLFLLLEFQAQYDPAVIERFLDYIDDARRRKQIPLVPILVFLDDRAAGPERKGTRRLEKARISTGRKAGIEAETMEFYWLILRNVLPTLQDLTVVELAPLYGLFLYRQKGRKLQQSARELAETLVEKVRPLEFDDRWRILESFSQVVANNNPPTAREIWEIFTMAYKTEPRKSFLYQHGLEEGLEKGLKQGIEKGIEQGIEKGEAISLRHSVVEVGSHRFGEPPPADVRAAIDAIADHAKLSALLIRVVDIDGWDELFTSTP